MSERKVVFIMGAGHCGSTLLDLILGSHSRAFSLAEFHVVSKFIDDPDGARQAICAICGDACEFWNGKAPLPSLAPFYSQKSIGHKLLSRGVRAFRNPYAPMFAATDKSVLVDSSKSARWFERQIRYRYTWRSTNPIPHLSGSGWPGCGQLLFSKIPGPRHGFGERTVEAKHIVHESLLRIVPLSAQDAG